MDEEGIVESTDDRGPIGTLPVMRQLKYVWYCR